jgi:hypothetical protein
MMYNETLPHTIHIFEENNCEEQIRKHKVVMDYFMVLFQLSYTDIKGNYTSLYS